MLWIIVSMRLSKIPRQYSIDSVTTCVWSRLREFRARSVPFSGLLKRCPFERFRRDVHAGRQFDIREGGASEKRPDSDLRHTVRDADFLQCRAAGERAPADHLQTVWELNSLQIDAFAERHGVDHLQALRELDRRQIAAFRECGSADFLHTAGALDATEAEAPAFRKRTFANLRDAIGDHIMPVHQVRQQFWILSASKETIENRVVRFDRMGIDDGRPGLDAADMHEIGNPVQKKAQEGKCDQDSGIQNRKTHTAFPLLRAELDEGRRVVVADDSFVLYCPYASRFPVQSEICPRFDGAFEDYGAKELDTLATTARAAILALQTAYEKRSPNDASRVDYNVVMTNGPYNVPSELEDAASVFRPRLTILPSLVKKAGFEYGSGIDINPVSPETAAAWLREYFEK